MSKLFKTLTTLMMVLCLSVFFVACDNDDTTDDGDATTGELVFELVTEERDTDDDGDKEEYEFYKITGYTVTSEDAIKMAEGDFSTVSGKREITIPATHENLPVEEIGASAFADQVILKKITFAENNNIKTIGSDAFSGCVNLTEIVNLPFVGKSADAANEERVFGFVFGSSTTLSGVTDVTSKIYYEATSTDYTYKFPSGLKKLSIASRVIPECAFYGMTMLEEVELTYVPTANDDGEMEYMVIGANAFYGCSKFDEIKLTNVEYIYDGAFGGCTALQRLDLGGNTVLKYIGDDAFSGCSYLGYNYVTDDEATIKIVLPDTVTYLGKNAFKSCSLLKYIELGSGITVIRTGAFAECTELVKVTAKATAVEVKDASFNSCKEDLEFTVNGVKVELSDLAYGKYEPEVELQ